MFIVTLGDIVGLSILVAWIGGGILYVLTMYSRAKWKAWKNKSLKDIK